jgi:hypothetical protein
VALDSIVIPAIINGTNNAPDLLAALNNLIFAAEAADSGPDTDNIEHLHTKLREARAVAKQYNTVLKDITWPEVLVEWSLSKPTPFVEIHNKL